MNLKQSYEYQNFLTRNFDTLNSVLLRTNEFRKITSTHARSKVVPDAVDEVEEKVPEYEYGCGVESLVEVSRMIIDEFTALHNAINTAKLYVANRFDIDVSKHRNKMLRVLSNRIRNYGTARKTEEIVDGYGYKIDNDGRQTRYVYEKTVVAEPMYDPKKMKQIGFEISKAANNSSNEIESLEITTEVLFTPKFSVEQSLQDVIDTCLTYIEQAAAQ